jgi:hypothetical protein
MQEEFKFEQDRREDVNSCGIFFTTAVMFLLCL